MKTRKTKTLRQVWIKWLDLLWGMVIHNRDSECKWCGKSDGKLDAHHIHGRGLFVRWDSRNGLLLCYRCHNFRIHTDHEGLRIVCIKMIGQNVYEQLYFWSRKAEPNVDFERLEAVLIGELKGLGIAIPPKPKALTEQPELPLKNKKRRSKSVKKVKKSSKKKV